MEAKSLRLDMLSSLPSSVIEFILSFLPFKEAGRTSILSREWKHHWKSHPKLEFIEDVVEGDRKLNEQLRMLSHAKSKLFNDINQVMSMHQGPIHEFSLSMFVTGWCVEVDRIINNLSVNNLKKLTLDMSGYEYQLPESLFSLHNLTDLYLHHCRLDVPSTFSGFGSLTNLHMENVIITNKMLLLFLSNCPSLKTVVLNFDYGSLRAIDDSTILVELFKCLSMIKNLFIRLPMLEHFTRGRLPNKLPDALVHLKYLCIRDTLLGYKYKSPYAFLVRSSPNLEKLKLKLKLSCNLSVGIYDKWDDYSDMWLEHLKELEIELSTLKTYIWGFLKHILAKSPVLKKVRILVCKSISEDEDVVLEISRFFLQSLRLSSGAEIIFETDCEFDCRPFKRTIDW